ncbi:classical arabinogalactan protein 9-like [Hevea brasiliensis]|uniref:classical arabinogalactan protein 9-like n=1 Tax=Hevea brasiliensis TaxID=3981 RepID=UPI0025F8FE21|nr:classical arabinogalactan protein 9-like [Hevea brasiliensis]
MEMPPPSPQGSPLQVTPLVMQALNPDSPPQQTPPPPPTSTYKRRIRSKSTRPMASAPPPTKCKDPPATPLSEPTPKNPRTSASTRQWVSASTSTPQAKSPSSSKKQPSAAATQGSIYRHRGSK